MKWYMVVVVGVLLATDLTRYGGITVNFVMGVLIYWIIGLAVRALYRLVRRVAG